MGTFKLIKIAPGTPRDVLVTRALMGQFEVISPFGGDDRGAHRLLHIKQRVEFFRRVLPEARVNLHLKLIQLEFPVLGQRVAASRVEDACIVGARRTF